MDMPYRTDQEVAVTVSVSDGTIAGTKKITATATSILHEIKHIIIWNKDGEALAGVPGGSTGTWRSTSPKDVQNNSVPITGPDGVAHPAANQGSTPTGDIGGNWQGEFPIAVDVFEEPAAGEAADRHRHGWFDEGGNPIARKGHPLEPKKPSDQTSGFYPAVSEGHAPNLIFANDGPKDPGKP